MLEKEPWMEHRAGSSRVLGARCGPWAFHHLACVCPSFCRLPWFSPGQAPEPWESPLAWSREGAAAETCTPSAGGAAWKAVWGASE